MPKNVFQIVQTAKLNALHLVRHAITKEETGITLLRKLPTGAFVNAAAVAAEATLEAAANAQAGDTVAIGARTYTFQAVLTNASGNVLLGATLLDSLGNLQAAINGLGVGKGTIYASATTAHADFRAVAGEGGLLRLVALVPGTSGNGVAVSTDADDWAFNVAATEGGSDGETLRKGWVFRAPSDRGTFGAQENRTAQERRFEVRADALTVPQALLVSAILRGGFRYTVEYGDEPSGLDQFHVFKVIKREAVTV